MVKEVDCGVQASFLDIVQTNGGINTDDDLNQTQNQAEGQNNDQVVQQPTKYQDPGQEFDDDGSVYTGKNDDAISDAGTAYTAGTQRT